MIKLSLICLILLYSFRSACEEKAPYVPNIAQGEKLYQNNCSMCHGTKGMADTSAAQTMKFKPIALGDPNILKALSPEKVFDMLSKGNPIRGMPSFNILTEKERWDLSAYVFSLNCNFQKPGADTRPSFTWSDSKAQTDMELMDKLKKRGVPEKFIQKELSAVRYTLE